MTDEYKEMVCRVHFIDGVHAQIYLSDVEIVRCKDCKWFGKSGCAILIVDESDKPKEDDYCSWAERKEE